MQNRKFTKIMAVLLLLTMMLNMVLPVSVSATEQDGGLEGSFTCWTMNGETKIDGILTDGKYVLTVPHDMAAADVVVYFTGTVTAASAGELAAEESKVTGAFANASEVTLTGTETSYTVALVQEEAEEDDNG